MLFPDRIVLGSASPRALALLRDLYQPVLEQSFPWDGPRPRSGPVPLVETDLASAEMIKCAANAFLATKISFINEIANVWERTGADVRAVARGRNPRVLPRRSKTMLAIGRTVIVRAYQKLKPWLEALEQQHEAQENTSLAPGLVPFPTLLLRLTEELTRAERHRRELGLVVFEVPAGTRCQRRKVEIALRDCLRRSDLPARLSENLLGVLLPDTSQGVAAAAERIARLLSEVAGCPVTSGFARYPADGQTGGDLIRVATQRSSALSPPPLQTYSH